MGRCGLVAIGSSSMGSPLEVGRRLLGQLFCRAGDSDAGGVGSPRPANPGAALGRPHQHLAHASGSGVVIIFSSTEIRRWGVVVNRAEAPGNYATTTPGPSARTLSIRSRESGATWCLDRKWLAVLEKNTPEHLLWDGHDHGRLWSRRRRSFWTNRPLFRSASGTRSRGRSLPGWLSLRRQERPFVRLAGPVGSERRPEA